MLDIVLYPEAVLRQRCLPCDINDKKLSAEINELVDTLMGRKDGAGLAAPQLGIVKRFFGIKNEKKKKVEVYINPEIVKTFGEKQYFTITKKDGSEEPFMEGCLSIPGVYGEVMRYAQIKIKFLIFNFKTSKTTEKEKVLKGYEAIVFQHELDHLDGILFIDHVKRENKKLFRELDKKLVETRV